MIISKFAEMLRSAKRVRDGQLLANSDCRGILDFAVSRDGAGALCGKIVVDAVICAFAKQRAAM